MKYLSILFLSFMMILGGCCHFQKVNVESVNLSSFRMESSSKALVSFDIKVNNPTNNAISIVFLDGVLRKDMDRFATVSLVDTATVSAGSIETVNVTTEVTLCDPMSLLSMGLNIKSWKSESFTISGKITLKCENGAKKNLKLKDTKLNKVINMFR
jgi:LEA14-like dessication related protein